MFEIHLQIEDESSSDLIAGHLLGTLRRLSYKNGYSRNKEIEYLEKISEKIQERLIDISQCRELESEF